MSGVINVSMAPQIPININMGAQQGLPGAGTSMNAQSMTATAGQTLFTGINTYIPGVNLLAVYQNGAKLIVGSDYTETSGTSITLTSGASAGDSFQFMVLTPVAAGVVDSSSVTYLPSGSGAVQTSVQAKLRQMSTLQTPTYSASMTFDVSTGNTFLVIVTNGTAFTINAPTNPVSGQEITVTIRNASGGALGAITWPTNFKMAAWTNPANGYSRSITLYYDGTANWYEKNRTTIDVAN